MAATFLLLTLLTLTSYMISSTAGLTVVDMTFVLDDNSLYWPGNPPFNFTILFRGQSGSHWYESNYLGTAEHGGTHVDAPAHFYSGGMRVDDIPAANLVSPAMVIDVKVQAAADPDYRMTVKDVEDWEFANGRIPTGAVVLMNSGWASRYPNASRVFNSPTPTNASTFHFPGIHPEAAKLLAIQRGVTAVGVDTPSTDYGQSTTFDTHVVLGQYNVMGLENVANMNSLPSRGAVVVIGLVKLGDGSGGPARILGLLGNFTDLMSGTGTGTGRASWSRGSVARVLGIAVMIACSRYTLKLLF